MMPPGGFRLPGPWPFPPRGEPIRRPTPRQMQMQAALRAGAPRGGGRGWQTGGAVGRNMFNPRAAAAAAWRRNRPPPIPRRPVPAPVSRWPTDYRLPSPPPGGWAIGGDVDVDPFNPEELTPSASEALMAEREMLQQQLQMADEVTAQEIMAQIMEINKELEMAAASGMAGGGVASLMGGGRTMNPRAVAAAARRRIGPPLSQGLYPSGDPYASPIPPPWGGRVPPGGG